jgi:hypothetical protein
MVAAGAVVQAAPSAAAAPPALTSAVPLVPMSDSFQQLQEALRTRHVSFQRLESWGDSGEWTFRCSVPKPDNPNLQTRYEAKAAGDNGLAAIRSVIEQIDRDAKSSGH